MAAPKQNFLSAHWDWLVALVGVGALAAAGYFFVTTAGQNADDEADAWVDGELTRSASPDKMKVPPADLGFFEKALHGVEKPASLQAIDPKKASFLASEGRVFCENPDCGKPISALAETCPKCAKAQNVVKIEADADHDGMPNDWEKKYGFNPENAADAALDADGDGFSNLEEFQANTNPKDKTSHPDYLEFLAVSGGIQDTELEFYFQQSMPLPQGRRFTFQSTTTKRTYTAKENEEIATNDIDAKYRVKTGWKVVGFEEKSETIPRKNAMPLRIDSSAVEIQRIEDGRKVKLLIVPELRGKHYRDRVKTALESRIDLAWSRGEGKTIKGLSEGSTFELNERKYKVVKLAKANNGVEVTVLDLTTNKEKIIR